MTIIEQLQQQDYFSASEQIVVDYLLEHLGNISTLTINELAKQTYTSNSTIIRVCHKLSLKGYKELKVKLLQEIESHKYITNKVSYSVPFQYNETSHDIINNLYSLYIESIQTIQSQLDKESLINIAKRLSKAKRIFVYAIGDSQITAKSFINKMIKIHYFPILASENNEEVYITKALNKDDCALFISYSGKAERFNECMKELSSKNIPTFVITSNNDSLLVKLSTYHIVFPNKEKEYKIATFYSQLAMQYILNLIFSIIYNLR